MEEEQGKLEGANLSRRARKLAMGGGGRGPHRRVAGANGWGRAAWSATSR